MALACTLSLVYMVLARTLSLVLIAPARTLSHHVDRSGMYPWGMHTAGLVSATSFSKTNMLTKYGHAVIN